MNDPDATPDPAVPADDPAASTSHQDAGAPGANAGPDPDQASPGGDAEPAPDPTRSDAVRRQNRVAAMGTVVLVVALAFAAGIAVGRATAPGSGGSPTLPPIAASPGSSAGASAAPSGGASPSPTGIAALPSDGNRRGRADAKVEVEYWADFQCPYCAKFAQQVIPQLTSRIADGTAALVHRDFAFLGEESVDASIAVRCAGAQGKYWPMHDAVYAAQVGENQGAFARSRLAMIASSVGLDATAFATCMDDHDMLVDVWDDTAAGIRAGITSTPTIDVNGNRFRGVSDTAALLAAIDAAAAGASPAPLPTAAPIKDPWAGITTSGREAGDPGAKTTVELWMDYQATASAAVANDLEPELRTRVSSGDIRVVLRDLATLGDESVLAATAVRCVAQQGGPAWFTHDVLSVSAQGAGKGIYTTDAILQFAMRNGFQVRALADCMDDPSVAAAVKAETAQGIADGLTTAPAVVVLRNGTEVGRFTGDLNVKRILAAIDSAG